MTTFYCIIWDSPILEGRSGKHAPTKHRGISTGLRSITCHKIKSYFFGHHCRNLKFHTIKLWFPNLIQHSKFLIVKGTYNRPIWSIMYIKSNYATQRYQLPCSYGENVPASMLIYGSILIDVTWMLLHFKIVPKELAITPFPTPLITPPVTKIYFISTALLLTLYRKLDVAGTTDRQRPRRKRPYIRFRHNNNFHFKRIAVKINTSKINNILLSTFW